MLRVEETKTALTPWQASLGELLGEEAAEEMPGARLTSAQVCAWQRGGAKQPPSPCPAVCCPLSVPHLAVVTIVVEMHIAVLRVIGVAPALCHHRVGTKPVCCGCLLRAVSIIATTTTTRCSSFVCRRTCRLM